MKYMCQALVAILFTTVFLLNCGQSTQRGDLSAPESRNLSRKLTNTMLLNWMTDIEERVKDKKTGFTQKERALLFHLTLTHPVAKQSMLPKYDPSGLIGFCFGRAMAAQLIALRMGLKKDSIHKLFVIGALDSRRPDKQTWPPEWRFHVTTLVKGTDGREYAIDPILYEPMPIEVWMKTVRRTWDQWNWEKKPEGVNITEAVPKFYRVSPDAVMPDLREFPALIDEKGKNIIEITFDPHQPGFEATPELDLHSYTLTSEASDRYFLETNENPSKDRFDFFSIYVNETSFEYNNYFVDLITHLKEVGDEWFKQRTTREQKRGAVPEDSFSNVAPGSAFLGSMSGKLFEYK